MQWIPICRPEDVPVNAGICALVDQQQIAIFQLNGQFYAIDNYDPFSQANVIARGIIGDLQGDLYVASPIYKHHFSLTDGQCLEDSTVALGVYPVQVIEGKLAIALSCDQQAA